ncbi:Smg-4/UPF3 family-domain-containing protein [Collybia nuda]|uniref:Smg-4/UPF3 family-domain-containing protein n=1 Tax=Collybia nuda TaxID=64659 RepID=A0A9P6CMV9_9AGAR|nr:Smg-4/UPF3 family-domain-containing protein [Collybia nuda]
MSSVPAPKAPPTKSKKDRERERERKEKHQPVTERLKTVVRRLPPNLPEDVFWQSVDTWVTEETVSWKVFHPGKFRKRLGKENIPSRAYIAFRTEDQLALFSKDYDGHVFRDKAGNESHAVVEFAPYQKIPTEKRKPDARNATIELDEDYISFLEALKSSSNTEPVSIENLIAASQPPAPPKTTPLLEALKAEKSANKDKEAILRNHAHYKDQINIGSGTLRKDDTKKKGAPAKPAEPTPGNKKPHKKGAPTTVPAVSKAPPIAPAPKSTGGTSHAPPKSPRAARTSRPPPQPKVTPTASKATAAAGTLALPDTEIAGTQPSQTAPAAASVPPRRTRPVIGLASRQFEAALSGAGVGASGERKSRREREKEREKEQEKNSGISSAPGPPEIKQTPPSPRRERGRGRGDAPAPQGAGPTVKIPSILQRADNGSPATASKDAARIDSLDTSSTSLSPDNSGPHHPGGGRGARRGRGRGRGISSGPARGG